MSHIPDNLKYVSSHEWLRLESDGTVTVGITDHAQELLGDIVYIELPATGTQVNAEDQIGVVESVKAASDVYAPIAGEIIEVNEALPDNPEVVNSDPYSEGWFLRMNPANPSDLDNLLSAEQYKSETE